MTLSLEEIQAASDIGTTEVEIPEWAGAVRIRGLRRSEVLELKKAATASGAEESEIEAEMLRRAIVEPALSLEQARALIAERSSKAIERIVRAIMESSGMGADAVADAKARFPRPS